MKICLLTGFEPFLNHPINPTQEIVNRLHHEKIGEYQIEGQILPVVFEEAGEKMVQLIKERKPDAIISLGLAAGRTKITPERIAINCRDGALDNQGKKYEDDSIEQNGAAAYFSTLPFRRMVELLKKHSIPAEISNTAGTYVCNNVMYKTLYELTSSQQEHVPAGFIHVPANHELAMHQPQYPSLSTDELIKAIRLCIEAL